MRTWVAFAVATAAGVALRGAQEPVPREGIDPDTGHRVVRLSDEPGSQSLYFHQNAYTPLVNLAHHDYSLEPNVTFTPDGHWIVFRSNMFGPTQVFAVEVAGGKK
jgi:hypothetical protein